MSLCDVQDVVYSLRNNSSQYPFLFVVLTALPLLIEAAPTSRLADTFSLPVLKDGISLPN